MRNSDIHNIHNNVEKVLASIDLSKTPEQAEIVKELTSLTIYLDESAAAIVKRLSPFQRAAATIFQRYEKTSADPKTKEYSPISEDDSAKLEVINTSIDDILYEVNSLEAAPIVSEKNITNGLLRKKLFPFIKDAA